MSAAGIACREDVEKEMRKNCISAQPKTQLTSTRLPSTGIVVKPSLKGPLSPHSIFNYAFLGRHKPVLTVLGENRFTATPPKASPAFPTAGWAAGHCLQTTSPTGTQPRLGPVLGEPSGKTQGRGSRLAQPRRGAGDTCSTNLPDAPGARPGRPPPAVAAWKPLAFKKYLQEWKGGGKKEMVFAEAHSSAHFHVCQSLLAWL